VGGTDLIQWENLPIALYPDAIGPIWSGSAVVDAQNTSGLVPGGGLIAIFSYQDQSQGIAYSTDKGRTWTMYAGNPVIPALAKDFRDPKVFWHAATGKWVMIIAAGNQIQLFTSPNLIDWEFASSLSGQFPIRRYSGWRVGSAGFVSAGTGWQNLLGDACQREPDGTSWGWWRSLHDW